MYSTGNATVDEVGQLHLEGNTIPHIWYETIKLPSGKPDLNAIVILAEILYWYRPSVVRNEQSGMLVQVKKKFKADLLQKSYKNFEDQFGLSAKQTRESLIRLEELGVVKRVFRTIKTAMGNVPNVMYLELSIGKLREISRFTRETYPSLEGNIVFPPRETPPSPEGKTNTDITTKTTTKITKELISSAFEEFWKVYPRKIDKKNAEDKFKTKVQKHDAAIIIQGAKNYAAHCSAKEIEKQFIKYPSTFLNKESYNNEFDLEPGRKGNSGKAEAAEKFRVENNLPF